METMERDNRLIAPAHIRNRFTRALASYDSNAVAQQQITQQAATMLADYLRPFRHCLEIGCGTGGFTRHLQQLLPCADWTLNDLCAGSLPIAAASAARPPRCIAGDAEQADLGSGYELIASTSVFQWFHYPERIAGKLAEMQPKDGVLLFTSFSPGNLQEVREVTGKGLVYPTAADWQAWLAPYYRVEECREEEIRLTFASPLDVLRHLKQTGVTATASGHWTRGMQEEFAHRYLQLYSTADNQVTLTYRPLYVVAVRL